MELLPALDDWLKPRGGTFSYVRSRRQQAPAESQARPPKQRSGRDAGRPCRRHGDATAGVSRARAGRRSRRALGAARDGFRALLDGLRDSPSHRVGRDHEPEPCSRGPGDARSARVHPRHRPTKHGPRKLVASAADANSAVGGSQRLQWPAVAARKSAIASASLPW